MKQIYAVVTILLLFGALTIVEAVASLFNTNGREAGFVVIFVLVIAGFILRMWIKIKTGGRL